MCPRFADIQDCPLYHGMHEPGPSCYDAEGLPFGKCAVALGKIRAAAGPQSAPCV